MTSSQAQTAAAAPTSSQVVEAAAPLQLQPGDILLFPTFGWGILTPLARWLMKYSHVAMYFDATKRGLPLIVESWGRGVCIVALDTYAGQTVVVMRPKRDGGLGQRAADAAEHIADNPHAFYGYLDIARWVLPKLLAQKLGRWLPAKWLGLLTLWERTYHRNHVYICSELVEEAYRAAGCPLVDEATIPMPDDIAASDQLVTIGQRSI